MTDTHDHVFPAEGKRNATVAVYAELEDAEVAELHVGEPQPVA